MGERASACALMRACINAFKLVCLYNIMCVCLFTNVKQARYSRYYSLACCQRPAAMTRRDWPMWACTVSRRGVCKYVNVNNCMRSARASHCAWCVHSSHYR